MKYHIVVRRLAERDLEEAEDWYDEQQSGLGTEFRGAISDLFGRLTDNPRIYQESMVKFTVRCCVDLSGPA